jgi:membrane protein YqaA with SNARE-associated domain
MPILSSFAPLAFSVTRSVRHWIFHLGALGFIPLGLLDSSVIPLPGSMDVLLVVLAAQNPELWLYYALIATLGSVIGGFVTYRIARKGGKETLERKLRPKTLKKVASILEHWGFGAIALAALLPPPMPLVPFLLTAGAMQYSVKKFISALTLGRIIRYAILGFLAAHYGRQVLNVLSLDDHPALLVSICVIAAVIAFLIFLFVKKRGMKSRQ